MKPLFLISVTLSSLLLSSCFTGVESTPKITQKDVKRQNITVSDEEAFASSLRVEPFGNWHPGRRFQVVDNRLSLLLENSESVNAGDVLTFSSVDQRLGFTGDSVSVLTFRRADASPLSYRVESALSALSQRTFQLPFAVDMTLVARADSLLRGHTFYVKSPLWVDDNLHATTGRRYVPVTITSVGPGTELYPLHVCFRDAGGAAAGILMTVEQSGMSTRCFDDLFTFTDPHLRYPQITDDVWQLIVNSDVREGMTRDECRLALGIPSDVSKGQNGSFYFERWTYENGAYLMFEDGLLTTFRR